MTQVPRLDPGKTGQGGKVLFLPPRFFKPRREWNNDDWREDWETHVRLLRSKRTWANWEKHQDLVQGRRRDFVDEDSNFALKAWAWIAVIVVCILAFALLLFHGTAGPVMHPAVPYGVPYLQPISSLIMLSGILDKSIVSCD